MKSPGCDGFPAEFCKKFRKDLMPTLLKLKGKKFSQTHSQRQYFDYPDTKTKDPTTTEDCRPICPVSIDGKLLILANRMQKIIKIIHHAQVGFIPGVPRQFSICKFINVIFLTHIAKDKNHIIISIDADKDFHKVLHSFMMKTLLKLWIYGLLQYDKSHQ